ncbi:hypothetical protein [Desulfosarcina variabilis]|uniref:hypothetical protein n=1 Tax=Desulfosarcina variabilis TaxID=2300 RepID=UPI003AFA2736
MTDNSNTKQIQKDEDAPAMDEKDEQSCCVYIDACGCHVDPCCCSSAYVAPASACCC